MPPLTEGATEMISRLGMYDLTRQIHQSQRVPDLRDYDRQSANMRATGMPDEVGMFLRLGAVILSVMGVAAAIIWAAN